MQSDFFPYFETGNMTEFRECREIQEAQIHCWQAKDKTDNPVEPNLCLKTSPIRPSLELPSTESGDIDFKKMVSGKTKSGKTKSGENDCKVQGPRKEGPFIC